MMMNQHKFLYITQDITVSVKRVLSFVEVEILQTSISVKELAKGQEFISI